MGRNHITPDDELSLAEFIDKYSSDIVTTEYLKARYAWVKNPTKENWLLACKAYEGTRAHFIHKEEQNPPIQPASQLSMF
jgi:hypothetical protein